MKLILLTGAALLASAGDATAAKLQNKAVLGAWCTMAAEPNAQGPEIYYPLGLGEECGDGILRIKPDRYEEVESGCRYTEVKTWFDPTILFRSSRLPGMLAVIAPDRQSFARG